MEVKGPGSDTGPFFYAHPFEIQMTVDMGEARVIYFSWKRPLLAKEVLN